MNQGESYEINFTIPQGATGPVGPAGTNIARSAYLATFNNGTVGNGLAVPAKGRLPIDREELDISDLITLDTTDETIQFNIEGYYKITFTVNAYVLHKNNVFDKTTDFVSLGFKKAGTDNIYIGTSQFITEEIPVQMVGQGIIAVTNTTDLYELVNLTDQNIYLDSPDLPNISSTSYFTNPLLTIVIEYLGRQGA